MGMLACRTLLACMEALVASCVPHRCSTSHDIGELCGTADRRLPSPVDCVPRPPSSLHRLGCLCTACDHRLITDRALSQAARSPRRLAFVRFHPSLTEQVPRSVTRQPGCRCTPAAAPALLLPGAHPRHPRRRSVPAGATPRWAAPAAMAPTNVRALHYVIKVGRGGEPLSVVRAMDCLPPLAPARRRRHRIGPSRPHSPPSHLLHCRHPPAGGGPRRHRALPARRAGHAHAAARGVCPGLQGRVQRAVGGALEQVHDGLCGRGGGQWGGAVCPAVHAAVCAGVHAGTHPVGYPAASTPPRLPPGARTPRQRRVPRLTAAACRTPRLCWSWPTITRCTPTGAATTTSTSRSGTGRPSAAWRPRCGGPAAPCWARCAKRLAGWLAGAAAR